MSEREEHLYDPKCYDLAEYFLLGENGDADDLAYTIQTAVEDWFEAKRLEGNR